MIYRRKRALIAVVAIGALATGGAAIAGATSGGGDDDATDTAIRGAALDRAKSVALDYVGEGRVTGSEVGDEEGYYEVEVTRADGRQVDVHLDRDFGVLNARGDGAGDGRDDGAAER
jgi:hypothetical protein